MDHLNMTRVNSDRRIIASAEQINQEVQDLLSKIDEKYLPKNIRNFAKRQSRVLYDISENKSELHSNTFASPEKSKSAMGWGVGSPSNRVGSPGGIDDISPNFSFVKYTPQKTFFPSAERFYDPVTTEKHKQTGVDP